ncbi:unnamed protein product [Calicophoron daubneyi]|uniref:Uncharacterized protein n=1 Tax=Calicophoron daubneyi TaxID=300641 RepID=A0AAV2TMY1_CALDB
MTRSLLMHAESLVTFEGSMVWRWIPLIRISCAVDAHSRRKVVYYISKKAIANLVLHLSWILTIELNLWHLGVVSALSNCLRDPQLCNTKTGLGPMNGFNKVGLLNGQPISRRTVYLSASSSDSGDFPSEDEVEGGLSPVRDPTSKAMAIRAQRARAKPILTNARGPSVMIGGMTSISLCRRHRKLDVECEDKSRGNDRSSSSNSSASRDHHRRDSSGSSNRSSRRSRYGRKWHRTKRSRVEYITTFGGNEEEEKPDRPGRNSTSGGKLPWQSDKPPGTAASAVAASVVSKIFGAHERPSPSSQRNTVDSRPSHGCSSFRRSGMSRNRSSSSERSSGYRRRSRSRSDRDYRGGTKLTRSRFSHSRSSSRDSGSSYGRHRSDSRAKDPSYRSSGSRRRSSSGKLSRSPSPDRLRSISNHSPHSADQDDSSRITYYRPGEPLNRENSRTRDASPTPVRKRYYRPELESDKEVDLSDEDDEVDTRKRGPNASTNRSGGRQNWRSNTADSRGNSVGKMTSQSLTGESNYSSTSKSASSGPLAVCGVRLTPQELLKRRVQLQLTKAFNADKKAELEKQIQLEHERQVREEGLRRQARLLRRQEERRVRAERRAAAAASGNTVDSSSDSSSSKSMSSGDKTETRSRTSRSSFARSSPTVPARQTTPSYKSSKLRSPSPHGFRSRRRSSSRGSSHKISGRLPSPPSASDSQEFGKGRGFPSAFDGSHNSPFMKRHETELPRNSRQQEFNVGRFRGSGRPYSGYRDNRSNRPPGSDAFSHRGQSWQGNGNSRACPNAERRRPGASPPRESQWNSSSRAYQSRGRYETCFRGSQYPRRP